LNQFESSDTNTRPATHVENIHHFKGEMIERFPALPNATGEIPIDEMDEKMGNLILVPHNTTIATIILMLIDQTLTLRT
jgi:hypothetical protein